MSKSVQQIVLRLQKEAEKEQSIFWFRCAIVELVDNFLLDLENASRNLQSLGTSSECYSSLQLCEFFIGTNSDIFMQLSAQGVDVTPTLAEIKSNEPTPEEKCSVGFCTWLIHRLLRLLSIAGCSSLHQICLKVLTHLLHNARIRSAHIFQQLVSHLVRSCAELIVVSEKLYACEDGHTSKIQLQALPVDLDLVKQSLVDPSDAGAQGCDCIKEAVLEFDDPDHCEVLQTNLMQLLLAFEVQQYSVLSTHLLYGTVLVCIELGDFNLKMISLQMLTKFMKEYGVITTANIKDRLVAVTIAMIQLLISGCKSLEREEAVQLEENTAILLESLIEADRKGENGHRTLSKSDLQQLFMSVSSSLSAHGVAKLTTTHLKASVMSLLCYTIDRLPGIVLNSVASVSMEQLTAFLLGLLGGQCTDLQFAAPLLSRLVMLDTTNAVSTDSQSLLLQLQSQTPRVPAAAPHTQPSQMLQTPSRLKRKRRDVPTQPEGKKKKRTQLFQKLLDRTYQVMNIEKDKMNCVHVLAAVRLTCEVAARCAWESSIAAGSGLCDCEDYLSQDIIQKMCACLSGLLIDRAVSGLEPTSQNIALAHVVRCVSTLLACHDLIAIPVETLQEVAWILSLPWLLILKHTPSDHADYGNLEDALQKAEELCSQVNEGVREKENSDRLEWIQQHVHCDGLAENITFNSVTNCLGPRRLLHCAVVYKVKSNKELLAFLFNDFLLLTIPPRVLGHSISTSHIFDSKSRDQYKMYKTPIVLNEVMVKKHSDTDGDSCQFQVSHIERVYHLRATNESERDLWVKRIESASRNFLDTDRRKRERAHSLKCKPVGRLLVILEEGIRLRSASDSARRVPGVGRLLVVILEGCDLRASDSDGKSDPYCEVSMGSQEHRTRVVNNSLNPKWNASMQFTIRDLRQDVLCITVYDRDLYSPNDFLGRTEVRMSEVMEEAKVKKGPITKRLILHEVDTGEVVVKLDLQLYES